MSSCIAQTVRYGIDCGTREKYHRRILHDFYAKNRFPSSVFWRTVRKFLNKMRTPTRLSYDVPKDKQYISLPFFGHPSYVVRNKLLSLFRIHFPQIDVKVILTNRLTIGSFFRVKEHLPEHLCSNVIYQYKCTSEGCMSSYVGSTLRTLHDRTCEHIGVSFRTGSRLADPKPSSIREHSRQCSHPMQQDSFKMVGKCTGMVPFSISIFQF